MTRIRPATWLIAAVALFLLAVAGYALLVHASSQYWTQIDTAVYRDSGIAVRNQPAMLYALELGPANERQSMQLSMTPISAATSASWQRPVESRYAANPIPAVLTAA